MLEVCFDYSTKGVLRLAQRWQKDSFGGRRGDVLCIALGLSEGDIASPLHLEDCPRREHLRTTLSFEWHDEHERLENAEKRLWTSCMKDLEIVKSNPPKIRIWLDGIPDVQCGLLSLADLLKDSETEIRIVELPRKVEREDKCVIEHRGWGEVAPQLFERFLDRERILTKAERAAYSNRWKQLKAENAPLRVVENGAVVSADQCYYDQLIRNEFPHDTGKVSHIIVAALSRQKMLTTDVFIAKRIQAFIASGELVVVSHGKGRFYETVVRCAK